MKDCMEMMPRRLLGLPAANARVIDLEGERAKRRKDDPRHGVYEVTERSGGLHASQAFPPPRRVWLVV